MRLAKYLAHAGVASRRAAETLIADGRVSVDGEIVLDPARDVDERQPRDGRRPCPGRPRAARRLRREQAARRRLHRARHPRPPDGRSSSCRADGLRLYPVGRLDADSSGLILLTNDGELANRLTHPRFEVSKTYRATLGGARGGWRPAGASPRRRAGRRPHRACARAPVGGRDESDRADDPRRSQPPGAAHVRGGRPPGAGAASASRSARCAWTVSRPGRTGG